MVNAPTHRKVRDVVEGLNAGLELSCESQSRFMEEHGLEILSKRAHVHIEAKELTNAAISESLAATALINSGEFRDVHKSSLFHGANHRCTICNRNFGRVEELTSRKHVNFCKRRSSISLFMIRRGCRDTGFKRIQEGLIKLNGQIFGHLLNISLCHSDLGLNVSNVFDQHLNPFMLIKHKGISGKRIELCINSHVFTLCRNGE